MQWIGTVAASAESPDNCRECDEWFHDECLELDKVLIRKEVARTGL